MTTKIQFKEVIMKECKVRQYGDTTHCHECGACWDTNDQYPPECPQNRKVGLNWGQKIDKTTSFLWSCVKLAAVLLVIYFGVSACLLMPIYLKS